jgi:hypothetical protein
MLCEGDRIRLEYGDNGVVILSFPKAAPRWFGLIAMNYRLSYCQGRRSRGSILSLNVLADQDPDR